jgi:DNA-binding response OmpR family regulator
MLTARGEVTDRIVGLELGADDYLPKPFVPRELVARIQTVLKRSHHQPRSEAAKTTFGELVVDLDRRTAYLHEEDLELTSMEFETLKMLSESPGKTFSRDEILNNLRGFEADVFSRAVDITISRLRTKLQDDSKNPTYIKTVWGVGYVFLRSSSQS